VLKEPGFYSPGSLIRLLPCPVSEDSLSETEPRYNVEILPPEQH
jgi:hypothetical protein